MDQLEHHWERQDSARHHLWQSSAGEVWGTRVDGSGDSSVQVSLGAAHGVFLLHAPHRDSATVVAWHDGPLRCTWHKGKVEGQRREEVREKHLGQREGAEQGGLRGVRGDDPHSPLQHLPGSSVAQPVPVRYPGYGPGSAAPPVLKEHLRDGQEG